ncbi:MAG: ParB/RepB/Spo0J family partition protein [Bacteroidetes bacterium]|nr:ParB/RepB/Spo0J family partition protein [Bacteroidota bacterium]
MSAKKKALGRGLNALLNNSPTTSELEIENSLRVDRKSGLIGKIPISKITANPYQPRTFFEEDALQELAESIKVQGIIQPITVKEFEDGYLLISGERRLKASKLVGLTEIPAYIRTISDENLLELALVENIQRENLNAIEISISFQRLIDECELTQEELSSKVGKNRSTITNYLRLLKLPAEIQIGLRDNKISMSHARSLISIESIENQLAIFNDIIEHDLSVREVELIARSLNQKTNDEKKKTTKPFELPVKYKKAQESIKNIFGTKAEVKSNLKGNGSIVIHFSSEEEFERIFTIFNNK